MKFVRKVYSILAVQLSITAGFIYSVHNSQKFLQFVVGNHGLAILACLGAITTMCMIVCCFGRSVPTNYILLLIFTLCESYGIAGVTAAYDKNTVIMAGFATATVTIALTIYAFTTTTDIAVF